MSPLPAKVESNLRSSMVEKNVSNPLLEAGLKPFDTPKKMTTITFNSEFPESIQSESREQDVTLEELELLEKELIQLQEN